MLKCIAFLQAVYECRIRAIHVAGVNNPVADALSRNRAESGLIRHHHPHTGPTSMGESDLPASPRLVVRAMESNVQSFWGADITESTMKVYRAEWSRYQTFANQFKIASTSVTLEKAMLFIAYLGSQGLAVSTIEVYLAGLRYFRIQANPTCMAPSLHSLYINLIIKGIKQINATLMRRIKGSLSAKPHQWENLMEWVACCTSFFGFLHCTEFINPDNTYFNLKVHLSISDLEYVHSDTRPYI